MKLILNRGRTVEIRLRQRGKKLKHRTKRKNSKVLYSARRHIYEAKIDKDLSPQQKLKRELFERRKKWSKERIKFAKGFYAYRRYSEKAVEIPTVGRIGLEEDVGAFLDYAEKLIDCKSKNILIDLSRCERIWPSAIMLFCSLRRWRNITTQPNRAVRIGSTGSEYDVVNSYLGYCGFYDYVDRSKDDVPEDDVYSDKQVVKIKREVNIKSRFDRQDEIVDLVARYSDLNSDEVEYFDSIVITEVINNVVEHGIALHDGPWYTLAQYHKSMGIISICIADNGFGIKNSLVTGPQKNDISKSLTIGDINDGQFITKAIEPNISGAPVASEKKGIFLKTHERGARRGNGLKRVTDKLKTLGIHLNILSQYGCVSFSTDGKRKINTRNNRIFSGTLYHLVVPASRGGWT